MSLWKLSFFTNYPVNEDYHSLSYILILELQALDPTPTHHLLIILSLSTLFKSVPADLDQFLKTLLYFVSKILNVQDATKWSEVRSMERGMQAVPILMENGTQTHLTHPKSVYIQYESRSFSDDEMRKAMSSDKFKSFITKAENLIEMAQSEVKEMINEQFQINKNVIHIFDYFLGRYNGKYT